MGFVGLVRKLQSLHNHPQKGKRDDATFDSNELYDIVSLMETEGGDVEQALSHPTEQDVYESMEVILPDTWTLAKHRRSNSGISDVTGPKDDGYGVAGSEEADSLPLVNLGIVKIESESATEECYEVERAQDESENVGMLKDPLTKHPISEIAVVMPLDDVPNESLELGEEVVTTSTESPMEQHQSQAAADEENEWMAVGLTREETQKRFMEDLKEIVKKHMTTTSDSYVPAAILVDDCATVMLDDAEDGDEEGGRLSAIQSLVMNIVEATTNVVTCGHRSSKKGPPMLDSSEIARAVLERERSIDHIVNELQGDTPKVIDATRLPSHQQQCDYEWEKDRRRRIVDDDSTISTHLSMQLDTDYNF